MPNETPNGSEHYNRPLTPIYTNGLRKTGTIATTLGVALAYILATASGVALYVDYAVALHDAKAWHDGMDGVKDTIAELKTANREMKLRLDFWYERERNRP